MIDALYKPLANGKDDGIIRSLFIEAEICVYSDYLLCQISMNQLLTINHHVLFIKMEFFIYSDLGVLSRQISMNNCSS